MNKDISNSSSRNLNIDENENKNGDGDDDVQLPVVKREKVQKKKRLQRELNNLKMFEDEESKRTVRASTKEKTIGSDRNRVQEDMIMKKKAKRITFQKFKPNFHQKDMLLEGLETEVLLLIWLMIR